MVLLHSLFELGRVDEEGTHVNAVKTYSVK